MGELGLNKIFGSIIAAALIVMGLQTVSAAVFSSGGHHGHHGEKKPYEEAIKDKYAYWTEVKMAPGGEEVEEIYDLGLLLASADASKGARVFGAVCASCHTINEGGANGTGPNLYGLIGKDIASKDGFGYSAAISGVEGDWTYESIDAWIIDPQKFARGSAMVANVKKDPDRANLIAYLAENTPGAPAYPVPLPAADEAPAEGEPVAMDGEGESPVEPVGADAEPLVTDTEGEAALDEMEDGVERLDEMMSDAETTATEGVETELENASTDIVEELAEAVEDSAGEIELPETPELTDGE